MKREEVIAFKYLKSHGYKQVVYEPDGNVPPDFLVNNEIAIEVRRLNKHVNGEPLEELKFKLIPRINGLLEEYNNVQFDKTDFIVVNYSRPLRPNKALMKKLRTVLNEKLSHLGESKEVQIDENLSIIFFPSEKKLDSAYVMGIHGDSDSFGFVVSDVYDNLKIIIKEKENKIDQYFFRYKKWWLLLIDYIGYGLNELEIQQLKDLGLECNKFEKVIFIPPLNPSEGKALRL